ncbi:MAG: prephenate dehydrogenase [Chloroflexota bacterium]
MKKRMKVAIIGGSGKMGRWSASFLLKEGMEVVITGRNQQKLEEAGKELGVAIASNSEAIKTADVVVLSVPMDNFEAVVKELRPYFKPQQIVIDITSVKTSPVEIMHRYVKSGLVLGVHPLFGPGARSIVRKNFVLTPTNDMEATLAEKIKAYLEQRGASVTLMSPQEHDEMMAVVLGLAHFIAIVSADTLLNLGKAKEREAIGGSTYKLLVTLAKSVLLEDPELYASLQMHLPRLAEIEGRFQKNTALWTDIVKNKDERQFIDRMKDLSGKMKRIDPDFAKAYRNMYRLLEKL